MSQAASSSLPYIFDRGPKLNLDPGLLSITAILLIGGLVVLASASISVAASQSGSPFFYVERQLVAVAIGLLGAVFMALVPTKVWSNTGFLLVILAIALLIFVLMPGVGKSVNGATRWVSIAGITVQVSEPARLLLILYIAGYTVRQQMQLRNTISGFLRPMLVLSLAAGLLLAEPDFGAATVLLATGLAMLFVGGARVRDFLLFFGIAVSAMAVFAITSPYRMKRLTTFLNPWDDPFDSGFQLTQSLIAIGRGEWWGVGLGSGVQKLFYLPEAHTDFVFAVFAEEFGLLGVIVLIGLFAALILRILSLAQRASANDQWFQAYVAIGIGTWLALQVFINIGVNMGLLPTKGLTLPLISYGRSSMIVTLVAIGLLLRIHHEVAQHIPRSKKSKTAVKLRERSRRSARVRK